MLKFGVVTRVDAANCRARVRYQDNEGIESWWLAVIQRKTTGDRDYHLPQPGEHVACMVDAHNDEGVILGAIYSAADPAPVSSQDKRHTQFEDKTEVEYDRKTHEMRASIRGGVETSVLKKLQRHRINKGNLLIKLVKEKRLPKEPPEIVPADDWKKLKGYGYVVIESERMICLNAPTIVMLCNNTVTGKYVPDLIEDEVYSEQSREE
jgi:phage baseplate assembly protein gpV